MIFRNDRERKSAAGKPDDRVYPLLPLRDIIVFPHMMVPLFVGRDKSIAALDEAMNRDKMILLAAQKKAKTNDPTQEDIYRVGTLSSVVQLLRLPDGTVKVLVECKKRARIREYVPNDRFFQVRVDDVPDQLATEVEVTALKRSVSETFEQYSKLNKRVPREMIMSAMSLDDPSRLADTVAAHLNLKLEDKQELLEVDDVGARLERLLELMRSEIEVLQVEKRIRSRVRKQMEKSQKEYYLNEQMRAIQKELGEKDEFKSEIVELEEKLKAKDLPDEAREKAEKEIRKLKMMSPMSAEATVVRNYVDWILSLPWNEHKPNKLDLDEAQQILDTDHYGLEKVKERILEYLAVQSLVEKIKGPILCFVGPPGVGKTSLGKSIAHATGRDFVRISLGGIRDEAEIRGHRRTYIGALPGKIIQAMKKAGSSNAVFLLDEIDKMSADFRGDPAAALLEVLDPEQNHSFNDHYLDMDYDLSNVMFITTANTLYSIPRPLQDRMEIIRLPGYTEIEKTQIARRFLVPKQITDHGLDADAVQFTTPALQRMIREYTKEAGVRNLEREVANVCRKVARQVVKSEGQHRERITPQALQRHLGVPKFRYGTREEKHEIGMATGLAWTDVGGELLATEVTMVPGKGKLTITGKLGDVMQESAQAAMSYVRSRATRLGLRPDFYQHIDLHIHVPEGAIPKDGPSAGITMATAITSALTRLPVRRNVAMTGEITLRGRVLPIGGLKEKILAAHRGDIDHVIIPSENEKDLKDIPASVLANLKVDPVSHVDQVLNLALVLDEGKPLFRDSEDDPLSKIFLAPGEVPEEGAPPPDAAPGAVPEVTKH